MDAKYVKAGDYQNMKKSIVIFICLEDYFGMRLQDIHLLLCVWNVQN